MNDDLRLEDEMIAENLTIRRKWFELIRIGTKKEEYRSAGNAQVAKAYKRVSCGLSDDDSVMILRNGYRMDSPALAAQIFAMGIRSGDMAAHPEWGEPTGKGSHFVISLGKVLFVAPYHDVRAAFKEGGAKEMLRGVYSRLGRHRRQTAHRSEHKEAQQ